VTDEARDLGRQAAYIDTVRGREVGTRNAGFVACLIGALVLIASRFVGGWPAWGMWVGVAIILLGWALFVISVLRRADWVRAHPFDPNG
jgi:VIT1/CCC1 family predicted Fe2+/Mn2+ transporter